MVLYRHNKQLGFTIVELLIVIVVIGILATITIVAYNGIQARAQSAAVDAALSQANKKLSLYKIDNDTYPPTLSAAGITSSAVTYQYGTDGSTYCVSATSGNVSHYSTGIDLTNGFCENTGIIGWWKLNGSANDEGPNGYNGTVSGASLVAGQNGTSNGAYSFDGISQTISYASNFGIGTTNLTISTWIYNPLASNKGAFVKVGSSGGYGIGMGSNGGGFGGNGNILILLYEGVRWMPTTVTISTGWHHVAMTVSSTGVPSAYLDGSLVGTYPGSNPLAPSAQTNIGGYTARFFNGYVDDTRIYNRALAASEIQSLYSAGAK